MLDVTDFIAERGGNPEKIKCAPPFHAGAKPDSD